MLSLTWRASSRRDPDFVLDDWVGDTFTYLVGRGELDGFAASDRPYTTHIAHRIQHELIDSAHDSGGWAWQPRDHEPNVWHRPGRCPSSGRW